MDANGTCRVSSLRAPESSPPPIGRRTGLGLIRKHMRSIEAAVTRNRNPIPRNARIVTPTLQSGYKYKGKSKPRPSKPTRDRPHGGSKPTQRVRHPPNLLQCTILGQ